MGEWRVPVRLRSFENKIKCWSPKSSSSSVISHCINKPFEGGPSGAPTALFVSVTNTQGSMEPKGQQVAPGEALPNSPGARAGGSTDRQTQAWKKPTFHQVPPCVHYSDNVPLGSAATYGTTAQGGEGGRGLKAKDIYFTRSLLAAQFLFPTFTHF